MPYKDPEKRKAYQKKWAKENPEKMKAYQKKWAKENLEKRKAHQKKWEEKNKDKRKVYFKKWAEENNEHRKEYNKKFKEHRKQYFKKYFKKRLEEDPVFRLQHQIRCLIGGSLKRKGYKKNSKTEEILGCSIPDFHKHIESLFKEGMSWNNRSEWEIDHITPVASANTEEELLKLNHFTNLQPLWTDENREKGSLIL